MKQRTTERGFSLIEFQDRYGLNCSLQKSSLAFEDCIWLGVHDDPKLHLGSWIGTRMHLTQEMVKELLPALQYFAEHGELPAKAEPTDSEKGE